MSQVVCFTDASHHPPTKVSVCGFKVVGENNVRFEINGTLNGCAAAEKRAVEMCIQYCSDAYPNSKLIIHTDHQGCFKMNLPPHVQLAKVNGHLPKKERDMDPVQQQFAEVDKTVRHALRQAIGDQRYEH